MQSSSTDSGEVELRIETVSQAEGAVTLRCCVRDTGIGIPRKASPHLRSLRTGRLVDHRQYGGTGLGLTISSRLVELLGGSISVDSAVGRGSSFSFTMRLGLQADTAGCGLRQDAARLKGMRALIVDDNATNRRLLEVWLAKWGLQPVSVETGSRRCPSWSVAPGTARPTASRCLTAACPRWTASR